MRCGNPTLGRFDSGAAPLSCFWRVRPDTAGSSAGFAEPDLPLKSAQDRMRAVQTIAQLSHARADSTVVPRFAARWKASRCALTMHGASRQFAWGSQRQRDRPPATDGLGLSPQPELLPVTSIPRVHEVAASLIEHFGMTPLPVEGTFFASTGGCGLVRGVAAE